MTDYKRSSTSSPLLAATVAAGFTGAVVGGTVATAKTVNQLRKGNLQKDQAVKTVLMESAGSGVATASAAAMVGATGLSGSLLGLIGFVGVAVGTKYLWDNFTAPGSADVEAAQTAPESANAETAQEVAEAGEPSKKAEPAADTEAEPAKKKTETAKGAGKKKAAPKTKKSSSKASPPKVDDAPKKDKA